MRTAEDINAIISGVMIISGGIWLFHYFGVNGNCKGNVKP